ncbi:MAG TPA: hypothetical protein VFZ70_00700 [Euzebyales bacterium]
MSRATASALPGGYVGLDDARRLRQEVDRVRTGLAELGVGASDVPPERR